MDKSKKQKDLAGKAPVEPAATDAAAAPKDAKRRPLKTFREESVSASVWSREVSAGQQRRTYYSVTLERAYKVPGQPWRYTHSFDATDLGNVAEVIEQADEFILELQAAEAAQ